MLEIREEYLGDFVILDGDSQVGALRIDTEDWRDNGELTLGDSLYRFSSKATSWKSDVEDLRVLFLKEDDNILARAEWGLWHKECIIEHEGNQYVLKKKSMARFRSVPFTLHSWDNQIGYMSRKPSQKLDLPENIPLFLRIFIFWLVICWDKYGGGAEAPF